MEKPLFTPTQIFSLKRKTIEKRMDRYFNDTHDAKQTIQILVALQVRDELAEEDFSFCMMELVRRILMKSKTSRTLRRYYIYFKNYFSSKEWKVVSLRLFAAKSFIKEKIEKVISQFITEPLQGLVGS
ncbi:hypothetical protein [Enterococcus sp.]|uniref:hypothetical protein n=1 Tax=Enterococcus sp. TaxID=35783 RepID=UPI00290A66AB|nr:hypothetical protein [Enterococcus sp.]MDU5335329.1 hypothetical protein [Enterococcus sp.]